ncbi:class I SAM-dependent methyltransferase [Streptomyces hoynatensis]|uniref:Methyltransferase domain-containing protein n=1 Tax=Streptomyces hoynatensis TaxID=1141874 RepID=A0A3A9YN20_9ACTN|nr:class I SAM-dependent methyltransferase [Streptomyces hoynatensis]RKN37513.1 methyltransferase domain-containing protein [Streptomyces hoynatensis]
MTEDSPGDGRGDGPGGGARRERPAGDWRELNRENWDDRVRVHAASAFYDLPGFRAGASTLRPFERAELGEVAGRRLLHLQCHMGQDTLSWARLGAEVTGLDFSAPAIAQARALARDTGLADRSRFVVGDVYEAQDALPGESFDIVYTGLGALVWLPELPRWARIVAGLLAPGGVLYLAEFHPLSDLLGEDGRSVEVDYFAEEPRREDYPHTYTDGPPLEKTRHVEFPHSLGEVVTSLARAGLRIEFLHEHPETLFPRYPVLRRTPEGTYVFPPGHPRVPLMFSLRAAKPAAG